MKFQPSLRVCMLVPYISFHSMKKPEMRLFVTSVTLIHIKLLITSIGSQL